MPDDAVPMVAELKRRELRRLRMPGQLSAIGWELPDSLDEEEWRGAGALLAQVDASIGWWIGDWWAFGQSRYGERKAIVDADDWTGPAYQSCRDAAFVSTKFELSRRRDNLSFKHHREVASLSADEADALLDWAAATGVSTRELRAEVSRRRPRLGARPSDDTCTIADLWTAAAEGRKWGCIYADPPWLYDNQGTRAATGNHYYGLTVGQLCELPIKQMAADAAHLHLWITNAFLFEAPRLFEAWGFEFRSSFVWVKPELGIGNYWRCSHEILLTAIRGDARRFDDHNLQSWLQCSRGKHSGKPEQVRQMLERASPGPFIELFARQKAEGWDAWGDQIERTLFNRGEVA